LPLRKPAHVPGPNTVNRWPVS